MRRKPPLAREGAILIVVLWVLIILSLLVSTLAFEMHVEANVTSYYRKRLKAQYLAKAGMEYAKMVLLKAGTLSEDMEELYPQLYLSSLHLNRGMAVEDLRQEVGEGEFTISLIPEQGRRNINRLTDDDWREILDQSFVPEDLWDELIDCFMDWVDADDNHRLSGAESDDEFYEDRGYEVKNAPLDTLDELLLIRGFTPAIVYGGPPIEEDAPPLTGIVRGLTTYGDGRVNINTASRAVLMTYPEMDEWMVDAILEGRAGVDGEFDTEDDGFSSVDDALALTGLDASFGSRFVTDEHRFIRVISIGRQQGVESGIWCVFRQDGRDLIPIYWREEQME